MPSSTYTKVRKNPSQMTAEELRQHAEAEGLRFYQQQLAADPDNPQKRAELESYCLTRGIRLDPERNRLYDMSKEQLAAEWMANGKAQEAAELESYRDNQASVFLASQPRYVPSQENSDKIVRELERQRLRGSAYDINTVFEQLVAKGEIKPKEIIDPVQFFNREEAYELPMEELRRLAEQSKR